MCPGSMPRSISEYLLWLQAKESGSFNVKASPMASENVLRRGVHTGLVGSFQNATRDLVCMVGVWEFYCCSSFTLSVIIIELVQPGPFVGGCSLLAPGGEQGGRNGWASRPETNGIISGL